MSEPVNPEDPIWSRWRQRHGQRSAPTGPATEPPGNGAASTAGPGDEREREPERVRFGDPLGPDWAAGRGGEARAEPHSHAPGERECLEWCPICRTADVVRATVPPELRTQLEGVQRDALVAMRALLDHYIDRLDGQPQAADRVEDIPIA